MKLKFTAGLLIVGLAVVWIASERRPLSRFGTVGSPPPSAQANLAPGNTTPSSPAPANTAVASSAPGLGGLGREQFWSQAIEEPAFAAFAGWTRRYAAAPVDQREALEPEGIALARARLNAMADLIQANPERALELAAPEAVRQALPASVQTLLEEKVNTRGDYEVVCVMPLPGQQGQAEPIIRSAALNGETFRVFTYGKALDYVTRKTVPFNGVAVPVEAASQPPADPIGLQPGKLMALSATAARLLETGELQTFQAAQATEPVCTVTGQPWSANGTPVALEFGGRVYPFSALALAESWADQQTAAETLDTPQTPDNLPTAESSYTEGRKRFLLMRVDFPDYTTEAMSTNTALTLMRDMASFMAEISYYKHIIAPVGQGSDVTPTMRMSGNVATYDNGGLSKLYPEAQQVARDVHGYDLSKYDFFFVVTGAKPAYGYAGLGYVGGVGFHLANSYFDVRTGAHEFGHNLGLSHANWWNTSDHSSIGEGVSDEYGDTFDTMGIAGGGVLHFSSFNKNKVGWIPNTDCPTVTASGIYRLYAQDIPAAPVGTRGLRLTRSGGDYWLEFRQLWTGNKALMNGVSLRWVTGGSLLLDMNPGSAGGKDDHPLTIGRTFSEPALKFHITPLGKGRTYPESMDVAINFGLFASNRPPTLVVKSSAATVAVGQAISFTAEAADTNNDRLAFSWDFGNGDYSVDNQATATYSFASAGKYSVSCTVSDMKGGVARDAVLVTVGSSATYTVSGHVLLANGQPLPGMRVSVDASRYAMTASDGTYTISGLAAGSYTVTPLDPVADKYSFLQPFFTNPVRVGPDFATADFIGSTNALNIYTPIVPKLSTWLYLDNGSDQGTAWITPSFVETGWSSGAAILGYEQGNETTTLHYGPDANNKYITYYFRKKFNVANPAAFTNLLLEVLRDDGVVVYLNGKPVFTNNMPANTPITYTTMAVDGIEPDAYLRQVLPATALTAGQNVLAAEIHQADPTSSDINFDLALSGLSITNVASSTLVYVASPANYDQFTRPTNLTLRAFAQSSAGTVSQVAFYADGNLLGADTAAPYTQVWTNPPAGAHTILVIATIGLTQVTGAPVAITVSDPVSAPKPVSLALVSAGTTWKYYTSAAGAPAAWSQPSFNDAAWSSGRAQLGYGEGDEIATVPYGSDANNKWITAYFRRAFQVNDPGAVTDLTLRLKRDDGAVVYLNGREVLRDSMPEGAVTASTLADSPPDDGAVFNVFNLDPQALAVGTNILAVEIHQSSASSSDMSFDLALDALAWTNRARGIWLTSPAEGEFVSVPGSAILSADVVAGGALGIRKVEFFADDQLVGAAAARPFAVAWRNPPGGMSHQIVAVATDSSGGVLTSAPANFSAGVPLRETRMVSSGELWKYLDDGSNQGASWSTRTFNDRAWKAGPAPLGYGGNEMTTISYGTNSSRRHITAYFRKQFNVATPLAFTNLFLQLVCDDAAVVYLNGTEVYRANLAAGLVSFNSLALRAIPALEVTEPVEARIDPRLLRTGTNCLAVELHQASTTSGTARFDLALAGLAVANTNPGVYCISPADNTRYLAPANVELAAYADTGGEPVTRVDYLNGATVVASAVANPFAATWSNVPAGTYTLTARATYGQGATVTSPPVTVTVGAPPSPISPVFTTLIPALAQWKYWDNAEPAAFGWQEPGFDDADWPRDAARLGFGYDGEKTPLTEGRTTWYFRRWFTTANPALFTHLLFQLVRDDGAVVYLNGREAFRSNMPEGTIAADTLALTGVDTPAETTYFETALAAIGSGLTAGSNLVAVELHQASAASSDAGFDLQLSGFGTTESRIYLTGPLDGEAFGAVAALDLEAAVAPGEGVAVNEVEFLINGTPQGAVSAPPYRWAWTRPPLGPQRVSARASLNNGEVLETASATVTIGREPVTTAMVASNSVWKYLDNGSNQGTNWAKPAYNDTAWRSGPARLGYGVKGEVTPVGFGPNANAKYITTYFRKTFVVPEGVVYTNLAFKLVRDDGAVIWLNGRELYRSNMPDRSSVPVVSYTTPAYSSVSGTDEQNFFSTFVAVTNLPAGTNLLAVEIHQQSGTSSDIGFNLELVASGYQDEQLPVLLSAVLADGYLELSWPASAGVWTVISTTNPLEPWSSVTAQATLVNDRYLVAVPATAPVRFYRLIKP